MTKSKIEKRIEYAIRYLTFDADTRDLTWGEVATQLNNCEFFNLPELMVLIHPRFMQEFGLHPKNILGGDFTAGTATGQKCRSIDLWGYECPFTSAKIHIDHSFPRSRGGATHPLNAMYLCQEHNLPKSSDIHMYGWEDLPAKIDWVNQILEKMIHANMRVSGEKIHFSKLKKILN